MQTAGKLVVLIGKFTTCVQTGEDQFNTGNAVVRVHVHRHAAAVVGHLDRAVFVQYDLDILAVTGEGFVNAVVNDFLDEMIGLACVGVHAGAALYGF